MTGSACAPRLPTVTSSPRADGVYESPRTRELLRLLQRAGRTDLPVLLLGETGTGKELAAQEVHRSSVRANGPLRVINCGAIPKSLIESTLFGYERGAFTGADRSAPGIFEEAHAGTVLLDEVGELSLEAQAALLRVLETKRVTRLGSHREIAVDVRVIAATHRDLSAMSQQGQFRLDILHRLSVIEVELPPLRERVEDIEPLARHFLSQAAGARDLAPEALERLKRYPWPGNIRELRNVLARAAAFAEGPCVSVGDLPELSRGHRGTAATNSRAAAVKPDATEESMLVLPTNLRAQLKAVERSALLRALEAANGHRRTAAALLGLPLRSFERRLSALRIHASVGYRAANGHGGHCSLK